VTELRNTVLLASVSVAVLGGCLHAGGGGGDDEEARPPIVVPNQSPVQRIAFVSERDGDPEI
jgi:hypothetical protein